MWKNISRISTCTNCYFCPCCVFTITCNSAGTSRADRECYSVIIYFSLSCKWCVCSNSWYFTRSIIGFCTKNMWCPIKFPTLKCVVCSCRGSRSFDWSIICTTFPPCNEVGFFFYCYRCICCNSCWSVFICPTILNIWLYSTVVFISRWTAICWLKFYLIWP